jgi:hypothetical protein
LRAPDFSGPHPPSVLIRSQRRWQVPARRLPGEWRTTPNFPDHASQGNLEPGDAKHSTATPPHRHTTPPHNSINPPTRPAGRAWITAPAGVDYSISSALAWPMIRKPVPPGSNFKHSCRPAPPTRRPKGQPAASLFETNEEHRLARSDAPPILSPVGPAVGARLHRDRACYDRDGGCRDAVLEEQLAATEILLIDLGASSEEAKLWHGIASRAWRITDYRNLGSVQK